MHSEKIIAQIKKDLLESFERFADSNYTGHPPVRPIGQIVFAAAGDIISPVDLGFWGYGNGPKGDCFETTGDVMLASFFSLNNDGEYVIPDDERSG